MNLYCNEETFLLLLFLIADYNHIWNIIMYYSVILIQLIKKAAIYIYLEAQVRCPLVIQ